MKMKTKKILRSSILLAITLTGTILIWRGLWELSERFFPSEISLLMGIIILLTVGFFARKFLMKVV